MKKISKSEIEVLVTYLFFAKQIHCFLQYYIYHLLQLIHIYQTKIYIKIAYSDMKALVCVYEHMNNIRDEYS